MFVASLLIGIVIYLLHRLRERRRKYTIREQQLQQIFAEQEAQSSRRILENEQQITLLNEQLQSAMLENDTFKHSLLEAQTKRLGATNEQIRAIRNEQEMRLLALPTFGHLSSFPSCHPKFRNNGKGLETIK